MLWYGGRSSCWKLSPFLESKHSLRMNRPNASFKVNDWKFKFKQSNLRWFSSCSASIYFSWKLFPPNFFRRVVFWLNFHYFHWKSLAREKKTKKTNFVVNNCFSQLHKQIPQNMCLDSKRRRRQQRNLLIDSKQKSFLIIDIESFNWKCVETRHVSNWSR